jgi:cytochrome P450
MKPAAADTFEPALCPRSVAPQKAPLPIHRFLIEFVQNPLRLVPEEAYRERLVVRTNLGRKVTWITDPDLIEEVLVNKAGAIARSDLEKRALGRIIGKGVLTSDGDLWRWQRRTMAPLFRMQEIEAYVPVMSKAAGEQIARWRKEGSGRKQIHTDMTGTTFAIIARTMLAGGEPEETETIKRATDRYLSQISWEVAWAVLGMPAWMPHPGSLAMRRAAHRLRNSVGALIKRRQAEQRQAGIGSQDLLARLLSARDPKSGEPMPGPLLIDNVLTLLEAGHETTAKALTWTLYLLARAPDWQAAARQEVIRVAGSQAITPAHLPLLPVLHQILKESMRLYPPAPSLSRICIEPLIIGTERLVPGDMIIVPIYAIHRHRRLWSNPDCFDPRRFRSDLERTYPRTQYMPFGAGPRVCLGSAFAMTEAAVLLGSFLRDAHFDWDGRHEPEPVARVTLRPRGGMRLHVSLS